MSKPVQPYQMELGLAESQKLVGNANRVKRGKYPPFVFPSGYALISSAGGCPAGYVSTGLQIYTFTAPPEANFAGWYYLCQKT